MTNPSLLHVRRIGLRCLVVVACFLWFTHPVLGADSRPRERVTLQLKWRNQFQFAGYYAAIQQGYYREAGLDVKLVEGSPSFDPTQAVLDGKADFGVGNSDLLLFRYRGKKVVVLADIFQHSPLILVARAASGAKDLQALYDKKIMMIPSESAEIFAYFKHEGVDPSKLNVIPHTFNMEDFISGKVDAMSAYSTDEPFKLKQRGFDFYTFIPRAGGIDFYGDCLFTTEAQIRDHPERVRAFREASLKGWKYAMDHPEEIINLILKQYNTQNNTREYLEYEAGQIAELMHPELIEVGHINPGRWQHMADTYAEFKMLPLDFSLDGFLYDPNPKPDYTRLYWMLGIVSAIAMAALLWILPLYRLNRSLRLGIARERALQVELRRAKDAAEAADAAKSRYLAVMTHEVRTPLSGLISLSELLENDPLTAEQRKMVMLMRQTGDDMLQLINDILEYSKIEAGHLELEQKFMDLAPLLNEMRQLFSATAKAKAIELTVTMRPGTPGVIIADVRRLKQILINLLSNAVKFTEAGSVALEVSAQPEPPLGGVDRLRWRFSITDTGLGIAPEHAANLFNIYAQAHAGIARRFGGTGLGLAISYQLAKLMGGGLTLARSTPGQGSTFVLEIVTPTKLGEA
ncbi:MAG TPA: ABC transporter substrate-binding protein [Opitutales bacterium]|nr:ABC transporter substrate-binding protein [Opitutales bacterium]